MRVNSVLTSQRVKAVPFAGTVERSGGLCKFSMSVELLFAVCALAAKNYPRKSRFGQQTSSAEAVVIFIKGHETLTSARQPIPVPLTSLQLQLGSAGRSDPLSLFHVQSVTGLCKAKLKVGSCFLAHSHVRNP